MPQLFVGNLPFSAGEDDLRTVFERFGRVSSVRVVCDPATRKSRGFAFVLMPSIDDADEATKRLSGSVLMGRQLTVNESEDKGRRGPDSSRSKERNAAISFFESLRSDAD